MANLKIKDGGGSEKYIKKIGAGTDADPFSDPSQSISLNTGGQIDAFGRLRVSEVTTQIDAKQIHDNLPLFFDEATGPSASTLYSKSNARTRLSTTANGTFAIRQSYQRFNYQSGKSQQIFITGAEMQSVLNVTKRVGYFNSSTVFPYTADLDGIWLETSAGVASFNVYKSGTAINSTVQADWNGDKLDGTGDSGYTLDLSKTFIYMIAFEWLGVGTVQHYFVIDGMLILAHTDKHANIEDAVYMSSPNHSVRYEVRQAGAKAADLDAICCTVGSEGALNKVGSIRAISNGGTSVSLSSTGTKYPVLALRLNANTPDAFIDLIDLDILETAGKNCLWEVHFNPTLSAGLTYSDITDSSAQSAVGDGVITATADGYIVGSGYVSGKTNTGEKIENALRLGMSIAGALDEVVLVIEPLAINAVIYSTITFRELI